MVNLRFCSSRPLSLLRQVCGRRQQAATDQVILPHDVLSCLQPQPFLTRDEAVRDAYHDLELRDKLGVMPRERARQPIVRPADAAWEKRKVQLLMQHVATNDVREAQIGRAVTVRSILALH